MSITPEDLSISCNGSYILVKHVGGSFLFDKDGNIVGEYKGGGKFSLDEKYLVIYGGNTIQLVETLSGKIIWTKKFQWNTDSRKNKWRRFSSADISTDGTIFGVSSVSYERYKNPDGTC